VVLDDVAHHRGGGHHLGARHRLAEVFDELTIRRVRDAVADSLRAKGIEADEVIVLVGRTVVEAKGVVRRGSARK
jgi:hypothetical protein